MCAEPVHNSIRMGEAEHEEAAEEAAWQEVNSDPDHAMSYGDWELVHIQEEKTA